MTTSTAVSFPLFSALRGIAVALAFLAFCPALAAADAKNFNGHYELAAAKSDRTFSLDIKQKAKDDRVTLSFSAAMADGTGSAPDATGQGDIDDGVLNFKFKDSYNNEGTGTLEFKKDAYQLTLTVVKVADPSPFHFYGSMLLKLTSGRDGSPLPSQK
jgi:hypothetical protein